MSYCEGTEGLDNFLFERTNFVTGQDPEQLWAGLNCEVLGCSPHDGVFQTRTASSLRRRGAALTPCARSRALSCSSAGLSASPFAHPPHSSQSQSPRRTSQRLHLGLLAPATQFSARCALSHSIFPPLRRGRCYSPNLITKTQQRKSDLAKITHPAGGCINSVCDPDQSSQSTDRITHNHFRPGFWSLALDAFCSFACSANSSFGCFHKLTHSPFGIFTDSSGKSV